MVKKAFGFLLLFAVLAFIGFLLIKTKQKIEQKEKTVKQLEHIPYFSFLSLNNKPYSKKDIEKNNFTIIIWFDSTCEHCQFEINDIKNNYQLLKNTNILMVSLQPLNELQEFYRQNNFKNFEKIQIFNARIEIYKAFGYPILPSSFIYNSDYNLIKHFKGETSAKILAKYIH